MNATRRACFSLCRQKPMLSGTLTSQHSRALPPTRAFITNIVSMAKGFGFGPKMLWVIVQSEHALHLLAQPPICIRLPAQSSHAEIRRRCLFLALCLQSFWCLVILRSLHMPTAVCSLLGGTPLSFTMLRWDFRLQQTCCLVTDWIH